MRKLKSFLTALLCLMLCSALLIGYGAFTLPTSAAEVAVVDVEGEGENAVDDPGISLLSASSGARYEVTATYQNPAKMVVDYTSEDKLIVDLRGYVIVYESNEVSSTSMKVLKNRISNLTGETVDTTTRYSGNYEERLRRIVVTTEDQYAENARKGYENKDFLIRVMSQQIAIIGKNSACCELALQYFLENYLPEDTASYEITIPRITTGMLNGSSLTIGKPATTTKVGDADKTYGDDGVANAWQIVFDNDLDHDGTYDTTAASAGTPDIYGGGHTGNDLRYDKALTLQTWLNTTMNQGEVYTLVGDTTAATANEILIGDANRDEVAQALAMIDETQFIVTVINGKIVATGHTVETQLNAIDYLTNVIIKGGYFMYHPEKSVANRTTTEVDDVTTTVITYETITVPSNLCMIAKADLDWVGEADGVVLPDGLTLTDVIDVSNDDLEYLFAKEDEIQESHYTAYCTKLENAGFVEIGSNTVAGSHFKTFANYETGILLQVDYNAFAQTSVAQGNGTKPNAANNDYNSAGNNFQEEVFTYAWPTIRVTASDLLTTDMPKAELLNPVQTYTKVCDSKIVSMDLNDGENGTGYVMLLEDGRFVLDDGGAGEDVNIENLWSILTELYEEVHGTAPSAENPVQIAAWILTHGHIDHVGMIQSFSQSSYVTDGLVELEYLMVTFPSRSEVNNVGEAAGGLNYTSYCKFPSYTYVKPVTGQTLYIANLKIETLFTHKDVYPQRTVAMNDTSTIQRLNFVATTTGEVNFAEIEADTANSNNVFTFISTGDLYIQGSRWLCAMYGTSLYSDMVAMAHHGGPGAESAFYNLVQPTIVWWPYPATAVQLNRYGPADSWNVSVNAYVAKTLSTVKYILISDHCNLVVTMNTSTNLSNLGSTPQTVGNVSGTAPTSYYTSGVNSWLGTDKTNPAIKVR